MGGNKKKEKKSSSFSKDDACANCSKLTQVIETYTHTIESLNPLEQTDKITDRVCAVEELVEEQTNRQLRKTLVM